jgi:hypothetical protein
MRREKTEREGEKEPRRSRQERQQQQKNDKRTTKTREREQKDGSTYRVYDCDFCREDLAFVRLENDSLVFDIEMRAASILVEFARTCDKRESERGRTMSEMTSENKQKQQTDRQNEEDSPMPMI